jgi:hypothetical protein
MMEQKFKVGESAALTNGSDLRKVSNNYVFNVERRKAE